MCVRMHACEFVGVPVPEEGLDRASRLMGFCDAGGRGGVLMSEMILR